MVWCYRLLAQDADREAHAWIYYALFDACPMTSNGDLCFHSLHQNYLFKCNIHDALTLGSVLMKDLNDEYYSIL